ncbi:MAG TPA: cell division protein FtsZ [Cytophagales bacterium]|jgi:cell division protein FtsZ|nr:cell division protein FtsZ [Cytophagales bacterium]
MIDNMYSFDIPTTSTSFIKVLGVGGGGCNAVKHMYNQGIKDVEFIICNTDAQALQTSPVPNKLQLGSSLTKGLGAGTDPEKGKNAALESRDEIREKLHGNTEMIFITAGMGGGTGTGAAPIIAKIAKELDILTVGIVTMPFSFEGKKKKDSAEQGVIEMRANCDTVIVIMNDKIREIYGNTSLIQAFSQADNILTTAAKSIAEIITMPGILNIDFADVKTVMKDAGAAVMGAATASGENKALNAAKQALNSPLLNNTDIKGSQKILVSVMGSNMESITMDEFWEINNYFQEMAGEDANLKCGISVDETLGNEIRVTVIATGFTSSDALGKQENVRKVIDLETNQPIVKPDIESRQTQIFTPLQPTVNQFSPSNVPPSVQTPVSNNMETDLTKNIHSTKAAETYYELNSRNDLFSDEQKRHELRRQADARKRQMNLNSISALTPPELKLTLQVPAYVRKQMKLEEIPHSSEPNTSRININQDNELVSNNKFLHDNVD